MNPELVSLLTAGSQEINDIPGGIAQITSSDIAGMLAKLSPEASRYVRLKWCGESGQREMVTIEMRQQVAKWREIENWRIPRPRFILDMCAMALSEAVDTLTCGQCKGRGGGMIKGRYVPCVPCGETGKTRVRAAYRAQTMGVSKQSWSNLWQRRYVRILSITDKHEGELFSLKRG